MAHFDLEKLFYQAFRIRRVEEKIIELYPTDKIQSPVHLSIGQEHHTVALCAHLQDTDILFSSYRCHAAYFAKGGRMDAFWAELFGKGTGVSKGKAGSMHLSDKSCGFYGSSAVVGAVISHAVGMAYALKLRKEAAIAVSLTGDGSTEEGTFFESLNMAQTLKVPCLFVIENNQLAIHAGEKERQSYKLEALAKAFDMPYYRINKGYDFQEGFQVSGEAVRYVKEKRSPVILEVNTCRMAEHVGIRFDSELAYRNKSQCSEWATHDILSTDSDLKNKYLSQIDGEILQAIKNAETASWPEKEELLRDVT